MTLTTCFVRLPGAVALSAIALLMCRPQTASAQTVANGTLTIALSGLSNTNGQVCISLFDNNGGFPDDDDAVVTQQCVAADGSGALTDAETGTEPGESEADAEMPAVEEPKIDASETEASETEKPETEEPTQADVIITFPNLVSGTYAVSVLHDENGDQQMNQGAFGIPTEGFGFSRNPVITTGAPEFAEVAIFVLGDTTTEIELVYF